MDEVMDEGPRDGEPQEGGLEEGLFLGLAQRLAPKVAEVAECGARMAQAARVGAWMMRVRPETTESERRLSGHVVALVLEPDNRPGLPGLPDDLLAAAVCCVLDGLELGEEGLAEAMDRYSRPDDQADA